MSKGERIRKLLLWRPLDNRLLTLGLLPGNEISFNGIDGLESPEFIQAVRVKAFDDNKTNDYSYLTNLAAMCFVGPALRWFENLDDDVQTNWTSLRPALLRRFPASDTNQEGNRFHYLFYLQLVSTDSGFVQRNPL